MNKKKDVRAQISDQQTERNKRLYDQSSSKRVRSAQRFKKGEFYWVKLNNKLTVALRKSDSYWSVVGFSDDLVDSEFDEIVELIPKAR